MVFLYREHLAYTKFLAAWAKGTQLTSVGGMDLSQQLVSHFETSQAIAASLNAHLWSDELQRYTGFNVSTSQPVSSAALLHP